MSLTLPGWFLVGSWIAMTALLLLLLHTRSASGEQARVAGSPLRSRLRGSMRGLAQSLAGNRGTLVVVAAAFVLVAGLGAAASYLKGAPETEHSVPAGSSDGTLARLKDYTRSIGRGEPSPAATTGSLLPDVNTMIERLADRLKTTPEDAKGWRMLGWSYFYTARYREAEVAYAKAVELDPGSDELKIEYEEVKAKVLESDTSPPPTPTSHVEVSGKTGEKRSEKIASYEAMPAHERDVAIRAMVDALANRLENSPRDFEGWTRLMRSRVVLGEKAVAAAAFRKALEVFKDDTAASDTIKAAAMELGLPQE